MPEFDSTEFVAPPEPPPMNEFARLAGVFFSPGAAFKDIAKHPRWLPPLALSILGTIGYLYAFSQRIGFGTFIQQQMARNPNSAQAPPEAINRFLANVDNYGGVISICYGFFIAVIGALIVALALKFLVDTILGAGVGFKRSLAAVTYGYLPNLVMVMLAIVVMYNKPPDEFDLQNPLMFNVGAYLPMDLPLWLRTLGGSLDLFSIWTMVLMAMGLSAASPRKLTTGKALGAILLPWAAFAVIRAGLAAMRG